MCAESIVRTPLRLLGAHTVQVVVLRPSGLAVPWRERAHRELSEAGFSEVLTSDFIEVHEAVRVCFGHFYVSDVHF